MSRVHERGPEELVTEEAFGEFEEATKRGEVATVAHRFPKRGVCVTSSRERRSASQAAQGEAEDGSSWVREGRQTGAGGFQKYFAEKVE